MICLFLKKNMTVHGSYSSYILLKSGTFDMSTRYTTANSLTLGAILNSVYKRVVNQRKRKNTSSILMQVGSQSCPKRITTTRSSSARMAWSTCKPSGIDYPHRSWHMLICSTKNMFGEFLTNVQVLNLGLLQMAENIANIPWIINCPKSSQTSEIANFRLCGYFWMTKDSRKKE